MTRLVQFGDNAATHDWQPSLPHDEVADVAAIVKAYDSTGSAKHVSG